LHYALPAGGGKISVNQFPAERPEEEKCTKALTIELNTAEREVLSSSPGQGEKLLFISFFISYVVLHGNTRRDLSYISRLSPRSYNSNALSI